MARTLAWLPGTIRICRGMAPSSGWATLDADGASGRSELVAGGASESIFQPEWSPDGVLHFVSDRTRLVEPVPLPGVDGVEPRLPRWRRSSDSRSGCSGCPPTRFIGATDRRLQLHAATAPGDWRRSTPASGTADADRHAVHRIQLACTRHRAGQSVVGWLADRAIAGLVQLDLATRRVLKSLRRSSDRRTTRATSRCPEPMEFPTERRPDRARASSTRRATATVARPRASGRRCW